jgi:hypothetical protein
VASQGKRRGGGEFCLFQDVERVYHFLRVECVKFLQGSRFERLQCSIYDPAGHAIALALEEFSEGCRHVAAVELSHSSVHKGAEVYGAFAPHYYFVDLRAVPDLHAAPRRSLRLRPLNPSPGAGSKVCLLSWM